MTQNNHPERRNLVTAWTDEQTERVLRLLGKVSEALCKTHIFENDPSTEAIMELYSHNKVLAMLDPDLNDEDRLGFNGSIVAKIGTELDNARVDIIKALPQYTLAFMQAYPEEDPNSIIEALAEASKAMQEAVEAAHAVEAENVAAGRLLPE